jgi:hypothetical protein
MKKLTFIFLLLNLILWSCNPRTKDSETGLAVRTQGFTVRESYLAGPDKTPMHGNQVALNTKIEIVLEGVENYSLKNGKAFPGLMLTVTDKQGYAVIEEADLFPLETGYDPTEASTVRGLIRIGAPMKSMETYHVKMRLWDKVKPENEVIAEADLEVL